MSPTDDCVLQVPVLIRLYKLLLLPPPPSPLQRLDPVITNALTSGGLQFNHSWCISLNEGSHIHRPGVSPKAPSSVSTRLSAFQTATTLYLHEHKYPTKFNEQPLKAATVESYKINSHAAPRLRCATSRTKVSGCGSEYIIGLIYSYQHGA